MKTRNKILLTIFLAVLAVWLFGCAQEHTSPVSATTILETNRVTTKYLETVYAAYNEEFFQNKLSPSTTIDLLEEKDMASTLCENGVCNIKFNLRYVAARRTAAIVMLHEMCHIKVWNKEMDIFGQQVEHGKLWRSCMLELDAAGAFRELIIDNYSEGM